MNTIDILKKLIYEEYFISFYYYDGISHLYMMKYENKYFLYYWILEELNYDTKKGTSIFAIVELNFQDLEDLLNKKYPIIHYYKTKKNYVEKSYFEIGGKELLSTEILEYTLQEEELPVEDFYLCELKELNIYVMSKKMKKF